MIDDPVIVPLSIVPALADCRNDRFDGILYLDGIRTLDHTRRFQPPKPSGGVGAELHPVLPFQGRTIMAKERQPDNQPRCIKCGNLSFVRNIDASSQARAIHPATGARLP
jgi:hypothetical protein